MSRLVLNTVIFVAGIGAGLWLLAPLLTDDEVATPLPADVPVLTNEAPETVATPPVAESPFRALLREAGASVRGADYETALDRLLAADLLSETGVEQQALDAAVDRLVGRLVETTGGENTRLGVTPRVDPALADRLLESLTLNLTRRSDLYLLLAVLRIDTGNPVMALPVLAQIENHPVLGATARELVRRIENPPEFAAVALATEGNHYIVATRVGSERLALLIDTGAAMTMIDADRLSALGYDLAAAPRARFATASGTMDAPVVTLSSLTIGGVQVGPIAVGALPVSLPGDAEGLLGMDVLRQREFRLDQDEDLIYIRK